MAEPISSEKSFPIVGIGASAGGLDALQRFLAVLPQDFGFALVFIQHLSPKHKSLLPELLAARRPSLVIQEISDGLKALPGRLYLAPPGKEVRIRSGFFQLTVHPEGLIHLPIDEFLASLAQDTDGRSIAVIFSGAGTDGSRGCQAVRAAGGTVLVQDPETAEFSSMPLAAIATGQADAVLSPEDICRELLKVQGIGAAAVSREYPISPEEYEAFFLLLREKTGSRFNHYKKSVISRRIKRRMYLHGLSSVKDYLDFISARDAEATHLASDLMIGVTSFFRDRVAWKALNLEAIRKIVAGSTDHPVRVWTPASATGEEAYSIAMMLFRELNLAGKKRDVQVFATDVNDRALERAREGKYPASISADMPQEYIQKYFMSTEEGNCLVINKEVRESVVFARHDLLTDPPFSKLDLIICRNFMIYLEPEAQEKCITLFHYALKDGGFLFLGNAETAGRNSKLFQTVGRKLCRVYRKLETKPASRLPVSVPSVRKRQAPPARQTHVTELGRSVMEVIQEKLLEEFGPPSVAIDQNYEIIYHNGPTNRYLRQPRGVPTQNLLELLPEPLRSRIRGAIYRSGREERPVVIRTSVAGDDNRKRQVMLRITKAAENLYIMVFQEKGAPSKEEAAEQVDAAVIEETAIHQLESELSATRAHLQSYIEQLKSLNEELQSSNEELQAANEELETSREELQSLNEELITVNSQLQGKIEEQDATNNDLNNFLASTNIPTIFLDTRFRVKRFTPAMLKLIKLLPSDVGRPIVDMSQENLGPDLISDSESVLENLMPARQEFEIGGTWYVRNTLPYRTADNRIEGVVVTYNDVTELKKTEERTKHLASFPELNPNPICEVHSSGKVTFCNPATERVLVNMGLAVDDVSVFLPEDIDAILRDLENKEETSLYREIAIKDRFFGMTVHLAPQFNVVRIYAFDITERKRAEEALRESEQRVRLKLNSILSPEGDIGDLELGDIIDAPAIQSLMEKFYELTDIPLAVIDLKGKVLVGMGWQEICTKFHRVHPETCGYCIESDTLLTKNVPAGEYKLYKCKNNMWDVATAIVVGGKTLGHFFTGQFLFDDETPDYEFFRAQAKQYGFAEQEYLAALDKVPRLSRATVDTVMSFFMKLSGMISQLSYSNIKLASSLAERDTLMDSLRKSQLQNEFLADIVRYAAQPIGQRFPDGRLGLINKAFERLTGYTEEELKSLDWERVLTPPEWNEFERQKLEELHRTGKPVRYEKEYIRKDGTRVPIELLVHLVTGPDGKPLYYYSFLVDITERKRAEETLLRLNKTLKALSDSSQAVIWAQDEPGYMNAVCRIIVEDCGYSMVWIGFAENDEQKSVRPVAYSGFEQGYLETLHITWADAERGWGPTGTAIRTGKVAVCRNMLTDPAFAPWREEAFKRGYASSIVFPLRADGRVFGAISMYSKEADPFTEDEVRLLTELTDNVAYGIEVLQIRAAQKQAEETLKESEEKYRSLFENMIDGLAYHRIVTDENGKPVDYVFLEANEAFEKQTGLKRTDIIGKSVREALPGIENDPSDWIGTYGNVALTGQAARFQHYAAPLGKWYSVSAYSPIKGYFVAIFEDVTESKKAEVALRESEERFRNMFERHQAVMLLIEPNSGAIVDANATAIRFYGYSLEQLRAMRVQDINQLKPEDVAAERKLAAEEKRNHFIFPHRLADGGVRWVEVYSTPFEAQGRSLLFSVIHDITERKQAEQALKESEERLRLFIEHAPASLAMFDLQMRYLGVSRRWLSDYGLGNRDLLGLSHYEIFPDIPDRWKEIHRRGLAGEVIRTDNDRYDRKDGTVLWLRWEVRPWHDAAGAVAGVVIFTEDITAYRKAVEERERLLQEVQRHATELDTVFRALPYLVSVHGKDGRYLRVNHAVINLFGFDPTTATREEIARRVQARSPDGRPFTAENLPSTRALHGETINNVEYLVTDERGEEHVLLMNATPLQEEGYVYGAVLAQVDITDRKRSEAEILKLSEDMAARNLELESANKEMESFIYSISHDLRAPIRTMSGFAKIIIEDYFDKFDDQGRDYLSRIQGGSEKATQLIDDLLRLARISRQDMDLIEVDLSKKAMSVIADLRESGPGRKVDVVIAPGLKASADPILSEVILSNLLGNAWKFTSKTEKARIEFGSVEMDGKTVYYVKDNGAGFDPAYADKMFWPFHRLHSENEFEGTGIGLTIVERVVRRHGGRIWAEGAVGKGATVYFTLG